MLLKSVSLENFRNHLDCHFVFPPGVTLVIGQNTAGKSNLLEAIYFLSSGKSFRTKQEEEVIAYQKEKTSIKGILEKESHSETLEVVFSNFTGSFSKRYFINGVPRRRKDFSNRLKTLLFLPTDLDLVTGPPSLRRNFLDHVLEQADSNYAAFLLDYNRILKQRNALLETVRKKGLFVSDQLSYWDEALVEKGQFLTKKRAQFLTETANMPQELIGIYCVFQPNEISKERLLTRREDELRVGVTLVGPHRDDFSVFLKNKEKVSSFASRGQQRMVVLQLKILQLLFLTKAFGAKPLLLLDDIFSELDEKHIKLLWEKVGLEQAVITTTHQEFLANANLSGANVVQL